MSRFSGPFRSRRASGARALTFVLPLSLLLFALAGLRSLSGQTPAPVTYTVRVPAPETQTVEITATVPTGGRDVIEVMMPIWSPGYYRVEDYAGNVRTVAAHTPDGADLDIQRVPPNRWRVRTGGVPKVVLAYTLLCRQRSVTTDWVSPELGILNGAATFITLAGDGPRPHEVHIEAPPGWPRVMTGLATTAAGDANDFTAASYDELVDSPIVGGDLNVHEFRVQGVPHYLVDVGQPDGWDGAHAADDLRRIVEQSVPLWGRIPYAKYVFLDVFRRGGGGLEHLNSTLLTANAARAVTPAGYRSWLEFVAHEYFHAFNVKRLRPVELGPFDYEKAPRTSSLWLSEGATSYFADLFVARAGLLTPEEFLATLSSAIRQLQTSPGRLLQTVEQSSLEVWSNSNSGVNADSTTVSYYVKGEVLTFLLDARIRHLTGGRHTFGEAMREAYLRYGGERGFTPREFQATVSEVAGADLTDWFHGSLATTEELDYAEALDWYGLEFAPGADWTLRVAAGAADAARAHMAALLEPAKGS